MSANRQARGGPLGPCDEVMSPLLTRAYCGVRFFLLPHARISRVSKGDITSSCPYCTVRVDSLVAIYLRVTPYIQSELRGMRFAPIPEGERCWLTKLATFVTCVAYLRQPMPRPMVVKSYVIII